MQEKASLDMNTGAQHDRATFLAGAALGVGAALIDPRVAAAAAPGPVRQRMTPAEALTELIAGNKRFAEDRSICGPQSARRIELASSQHPFAIILGCSDSRVPVETVFDRSPGDLFVIRVAGNFLDEYGLASLEYGVAVLGASLVFVLGHGACGALTAAVQFVKDGARAPGSIQRLVERLAPVARESKRADGWIEAAIERNVQDTIAQISRESPIVATAAAAGKLAVHGGLYDLHSGIVRSL